MSYAIPNRGLPSRGWVDRSIPEGPGVFTSNAEQWGGIPKRGISVGSLPLYGIPSSEVAAPIVSNAEQIGAIPELGVPIGAVILRGIPVYSEDVAPITPDPSPTVYLGGGTYYDEEYKTKPFLDLTEDDRDLLDLLAMIMPIISE